MISIGQGRISAAGLPRSQRAALHDGHCRFDGSHPARICHSTPESVRQRETEAVKGGVS